MSAAVLYQLYAYARGYGSARNVLLYPKVEGVTPKTYAVLEEDSTRVRIETLDLGRDLWRDREGLLSELGRITGRA